MGFLHSRFPNMSDDASESLGYTNFKHEESEALEKQLAYAQRVLKVALGVEVIPNSVTRHFTYLLQVESLEPIARGLNNKVYMLNIVSSSQPSPRALQPGCVPLPTTIPLTLVFRTVRNKSQTPAVRKVLNSIAAMQLVREHTDIPVASVYAYDVAGQDAWMVEEKLSGLPMDEVWQTADTDARLRMLESLADVFAVRTPIVAAK